MCIKWIPNNSKRVIIQLRDALSNPEFDKWNWTSFLYILAMIDGECGPEAHDLAVQLAEQFYEQFTHKLRFPEKPIVRAEIDRAKQKYDFYVLLTTELDTQAVTD